MREIAGNLWDYYRKWPHVVCITTNGYVRRDGRLVMGRGCALEAKLRIPNIDLEIGRFLTGLRKGQRDSMLQIPAYFNKSWILTFPVKEHWEHDAIPELISHSARWLAVHCAVLPKRIYVLPRPGCGNGGLHWNDVKPLIDFLPDNVLVIHRPGEIE